MVLIWIRKRTDSDTFPGHPTREHMLAGWWGGVSGAHRLVLFIQLEVAHKHFRLARPTESAQGGRGGVEPSMLTNLAVQLLLFKTRTFAELALELELEHELELAANRACYIGGG